LTVTTTALLASTLIGGCAVTDRGSQTSSGAGGSAVSSAEAPPEPHTGGAINYALIAETDGWNPALSRWGGSGLDVANAIFDRLAVFDESGQVRPYLARAIEHNADFTVWTIFLRPGVTFHDGTAVDAGAVKANLDAFKASPLTSGTLTPVGSVVATDTTTVTVTMTSPWSTYPVQLASQTGTIAAPSMLESPDGARHPVGSGPFVFQAWSPDVKLSVAKNAKYWRPGFPRLESIQFRVIPDSKSREAALRSGDVDAMENVDPLTSDSLRSAESTEKFQVLSAPTNETDETMVMLNTAQAPFDDIVARRALAHATDPDALVEVLSPSVQVATSPYRKGSRWSADAAPQGFDLAAARREVDEYKATHGGAFSFQLNGIPDLEVQQMEQLLQQQWAAAGIEVTIVNTEQAGLINQALVGSYQATMWRQFSSPNPDGEYVWWHGSNAKGVGQLALNMARNKDPELDAALDRARRTDQVADQKAAWATVQQRLNDDLPYIWLYHTTAEIITTNEVHEMTRSTLPDGAPALGQVGFVHDWGPVWIEN